MSPCSVFSRGHSGREYSEKLGQSSRRDGFIVSNHITQPIFRVTSCLRALVDFERNRVKIESGFPSARLAAACRVLGLVELPYQLALEAALSSCYLVAVLIRDDQLTVGTFVNSSNPRPGLCVTTARPTKKGEPKLREDFHRETSPLDSTGLSSVSCGCGPR